MLITNRRIAYALAMMMALVAVASGVVSAEDSQSVVKQSAPVVDTSKVVPQVGAEQKKVSAGQVSDLLNSASPVEQQQPIGSGEGAVPVPSSSGGSFFSSLGSFLQNLVRVDVRDKSGKANVDVKAPFVDVQDSGKGDNVNVKAPFVEVQDSGKGDSVNVKAPFVDVQVDKGKSKVKVKTPFFELNK